MSPAGANGIQLKRSVRKSEDHDDVHRVWVAGRWSKKLSKPMKSPSQNMPRFRLAVGNLRFK
jgi:hypothetical protein